MVQNRIVDAPSGWMYIRGNPLDYCLLYPECQKRFRLSELVVPDTLPIRVLCGREKTVDLCWAGFELEIKMRKFAASPVSLGYSVEIG